MSARKKRRKVVYLKQIASHRWRLMDPKRFEGKHGVAVTLYDHLILTAAEQNQTSYLMPGGSWDKLTAELSQRYGWQEETIDLVLRLLVREGFMENRRSRLYFPEFEELIVTEWPTARYMRRKARKEKAAPDSGEGEKKPAQSARDTTGTALRSAVMQRTVQRVLRSSGRTVPEEKRNTAVKPAGVCCKVSGSSENADDVLR